MSTEETPIQHQGANPLSLARSAIDNLPALAMGLIRGLFFARRPSAVSGFVVPIIVDAVNTVSRRWSPPHVCNEVLEALPPAFANLNPTAAISLVFLHLGSVAAIQQRTPNEIFWPPSPLACCSVSEPDRLSRFGVKASTTSCMAYAQTRPTNRCLLPAFAAASPNDLLSTERYRRAVQNPEYREATECLS